MILVAKPDKETIGQQQAYFAKSWLRSNRGGRALPTDRSRPADVGGLIEGAYWSFDGTFQERVEQLNIGYLPSSSITEVFNIRKLSFYPIKYAIAGVEDALRYRGTMFWECRLRNYVSYLGEANDGIQHVMCIPLSYSCTLLIRTTDGSKIHDRYCNIQYDACS
jgi:hypothetical protein